MMRHRLFPWIMLLVMAGAFASHAHDPYEITTRAYLYSNHLELRIEMEFPAAMLLANRGSAQPDAPTQADQFALALPTLQARAANFLRVFAEGRRLVVSSTNVSLGVENHVRFVLQLPATDVRGLKFEVGELKALSEHGQYGTSLTVVDMVRNEVLGQSVMFGDSPPLELDAAMPATGRTSIPPVVVHVAATNLIPATAESSNTKPSRTQSPTALLLLLGSALVVGLLLVVRSRNRR